MPASLAPLLIAEDDANDMFLLTRLLAAAGAMHALHIALDGREALRLLTPLVEKSRLVALPAAAFLDLKMPHLGGLEVLEWIRRQRALDLLPVVIMANTAEAADIARARELGAQCYLRKFPAKVALARLLDSAARFTGHDGTSIFDLPNNLLCKKSG